MLKVVFTIVGFLWIISQIFKNMLFTSVVDPRPKGGAETHPRQDSSEMKAGVYIL